MQTRPQNILIYALKVVVTAGVVAAVTAGFIFLLQQNTKFKWLKNRQPLQLQPQQ